MGIKKQLSWYEIEYLFMMWLAVSFLALAFFLVIFFIPTNLNDGLFPTAEELYNQLLGGGAVALVFFLIRTAYNKGWLKRGV